MRQTLGALVLGLAIVTTGPAGAAPRTLDRILAVVDKSPITLSEIRGRARPIVRKMGEDAKKPVAESELTGIYRELLDRVIDERILADEAERRHLTVDADEIDRAVATIASQAKLTPETLYTEAARIGLGREDYRDEVRRQLLDARFTILVIRPRIKVPITDEMAYAKAIADEHAKELVKLRAQHYVEVRP